MPDLKVAITVVEIIVAAMAAIALGDYLGNKVGHRKVAMITGSITLAIIVIFAIYAAVILA